MVPAADCRTCRQRIVRGLGDAVRPQIRTATRRMSDARRDRRLAVVLVVHHDGCCGQRDVRRLAVLLVVPHDGWLRQVTLSARFQPAS